MANHGGKRQQSGRKPGSPNRSTAAIRELAGQHAKTAIKTLVELMTDAETPSAARISASRELLERGFGKPGSYATLNVPTPLSDLSPKEAISSITNSTATGDISLEEGQRLLSMIEARIKAVEIGDFQDRLSALERKS